MQADMSLKCCRSLSGYITGWILDDDIGRTDWLTAAPSGWWFVEMAGIRKLEIQTPVEAK